MTIEEFFRVQRDPEDIPKEWFLERYRNWRAIELASTDWTQLTDAPVDAAAYATYRQELRDLTKAKDFANAEFPIRP